MVVELSNSLQRDEVAKENKTSESASSIPEDDEEIWSDGEVTFP